MNEKTSSIWRKVTSIWEPIKGNNPPPKLPDLPSDEEKTLRTISSNHTLHGRIKTHDLGEKGHNFDTTEVEMGKLGLHPVNQTLKNDTPVHYSNIDNATLTELKIDRNKKSLWDEISQTKSNIILAIKNIIHPAIDDEDEDTVSIVLPKISKTKDVIRILGAAFIIGIALVAVLYGINFWSDKKDEVQIASGEKITNTQDVANNQIVSKPELNVNDVVNYQAVGRGLIYNCRGKHWACVDKSNYVKCQKLSKSGLKECMTKGVLKTNDACFDTQRKFTTTNVDTSFCN